VVSFFDGVILLTPYQQVKLLYFIAGMVVKV